jgi:hypothetical protein
MEKRFRIVKGKSNSINGEFVCDGSGKDNRNIVKNAEKITSQKFVYDGWIGNTVLYKAYLPRNRYYVLMIERKK